MKLIDFDSFQPLKTIFKKMGISETQKSNFENIAIKLNNINWEELKTTGLDITLDDLKVLEDGTLEHKNRQGEKLLLYIRDFSPYGNYNSSYPKFHISWCKTLEEMKNKKRYEKRYVVSTRTDGLFLLHVDTNNQIEKKEVPLEICKNCLMQLNYSDYNHSLQSLKNNIVKDFNISEFFEIYKKQFIPIVPEYNSENKPDNIYSKNWNQLSRNEKALQKWICQDCGKNFENKKEELQTHHINGNKADNSPSNLEVLCKICHSNKPNHGHMKAILK